MPERDSDIIVFRLLSGSDNDLAELDRTMVALEIDRAGFAFVAVERTAGDAGDLLVGDNGFTIHHDGHIAADEGDVERLPVSGPRAAISLGAMKP